MYTVDTLETSGTYCLPRDLHCVSSRAKMHTCIDIYESIYIVTQSRFLNKVMYIHELIDTCNMHRLYLWKIYINIHIQALRYAYTPL